VKHKQKTTTKNKQQQRDVYILSG